jgi:hypothetical protein
MTLSRTQTVVIAVLAALCLLAWWKSPNAFLAAYLAAWWFCVGVVMGGLANVWSHNLSSGRWGEAIRGPLLDLSRSMWLLALLFLPVLIGMRHVYPWAADAALGVHRWQGELEAGPAGFKSAWLMPGFFIARSVGYLFVWWLLAYLSRKPVYERSPRFAALALIVYGLTVSLASVDWIMSLMPLWYSSVFGLVVGVGQMLSGMALAVVLAARRANASALVMRDLGNLLLMYVLTWAYLVFTQFLIIWAENLPHEIVWYVARMHGGWLFIAWLLAIFHFFAPLLILLFRNIKEAPQLMGRLAVALLAVHLLDTWWMVLPSLPVRWPQWWWAAPLTMALMAWIAARYMPRAKAVQEVPRG